MIRKIKDLLKELWSVRTVPHLIAAAVLIAVVGTVYAATSVKSPLIWIAALVVYFVFSLLCSFLMKRFSSGADAVQSDSFLGGMTLDLIVKLASPVLICNSSESIIWYNNAFSSAFGKKNITGLRFEAFSGASLSELMSSGDGAGKRIELADKSYTVRCYPLASKSKRYYITVWEDRTELDNALRTMSDENAIVAYIMADNLEEIAQYAKDGVRTASNEINLILKQWAEGANGILKEYQSDRYIFLFRSAEMAGFSEKKFDVLDKIREIRIGESNLSVTVSMGISLMQGTLAEKERTAAEALDMALQRGGDQVVVKSPKGLEFYGGKTQTVQKRTKVRARVIANELASLMSKSSNILIMGHRGADFDCIGACLGIARLADFCGVGFNIISNTKDTNFKKCYRHVKELAEYRDGGAFVSAAEAQELVGPNTLTVIVDVNNKNQLEAPGVAEMSHRTVYIDHHRKTAEFDQAPLISYIEPSASSACELVSEILEQSLPSGSLYKEEADIMYSGILLDTKQFTKNSGVRTFSAALYLRGEGANPTDALTLFKYPLSDFISEAKFESNVVIYKKMFAISCNDDKDNTPSDRISAAKAADKLLTVEGVLASFSLCRIEDTIHISARSSGEINVQLILEKLEGGGHFDAAATQLQGSMTEVLTRLKGAIDEYFKENMQGQ